MKVFLDYNYWSTFYLFLETGTGILVNKIAFFINQPHRWNTTYSVLNGQAGLPPFSVKKLGPGHIVFSRKSSSFFLSLSMRYQ